MTSAGFRKMLARTGANLDPGVSRPSAPCSAMPAAYKAG